MKRRTWFGPALVRLGALLMWATDSGVRVLPGAPWLAAERGAYRRLYGRAVHRRGRDLILPRLPGAPLAELLDGAGHDESSRQAGLATAAAALAAFHRGGSTHGDATAANVLIDAAGGARWFDFETAHAPRRRWRWRCADDLRALLQSAARGVATGVLAGRVEAVLDGYGDARMAVELARALESGWRALPYHLGQAPLSRDQAAALRRLVADRVVSRPGPTARP